MRARLPWRAHNADGWREVIAQADLTLAEQGALVLLQDVHWKHGWIPAAPSAAMAAIGFAVGDKRLKDVRIAVVLELFPLLDDDPTRRRDPELYDEWLRAREREASLRAKGQKGAEVRWHRTAVQDEKAQGA